MILLTLKIKKAGGSSYLRKLTCPVTTREFPSEREKGANQSADESKLVYQFREPGPAQGPQLKRSCCRSPK